MSKEKDLSIRNSTAEFLIFEKQSNADSIEVRYEKETLWLTQKMMASMRPHHQEQQSRSVEERYTFIVPVTESTQTVGS